MNASIRVNTRVNSVDFALADLQADGLTIEPSVIVAAGLAPTAVTLASGELFEQGAYIIQDGVDVSGTKFATTTATDLDACAFCGKTTHMATYLDASQGGNYCLRHSWT